MYTLIKIIFTCLLFSLIVAFQSEAKNNPPSEKVDELFDFQIMDKRVTNVYPYILDTFFEDENGQIVLLFVDGASWSIKDCKENENILTILSHWKGGHEIRICPRLADTKQGEFILKNIKNGSVLFADLYTPPMQKNMILRIVSIDSNGYFIKLSDGSDWTIGWIGSWNSCRWRIGDRIIINKANCYKDYLLINSDIPDNKWTYAQSTIWQ